MTHAAPSIMPKGLLICSAAPIALLMAAPLAAQEQDDAVPAQGEQQDSGDEQDASDQSIYSGGDIVVRATRLRGEVDTDIPVLDEIGAEEIAGYGASSIGDLIDLLGPQTGSARGRGGGRPVILLNGRRISSFRELRDLPPEAIERVQVFPEELALQYGYRPDQRVINMILVDNFKSVTAELEYGQPSQGGRAKWETQGGLTRIGDDFRFNINGEYTSQSSLTEAERGIARAATNIVVPDGVDLGRFRTLLPQSDQFSLNGSYSKSLTEKIQLSLNAAYELTDSNSLNGLGTVDLFVPGTSPFSQTGQDAVVTRAFTDPRPLAGYSTVQTRSASAGINSDSSGFRWSVNGNYSENQTDITTNRALDSAALEAMVAAGAVDPFGADIGRGLSFAYPDRSTSLSSTASLIAEGSRELFALPAGGVQLNLNGGYTREDIRGTALRSGEAFTTDLGRGTASVGGNVSLPVSSRREGVLDAIGDLSLNANAGYKHLTDFGSITSYGGGFNWSPAERLSILFSYIGEESAPGISDLGAPIIVTPNVPIFDFTTGQSVLIDRTTGGNPLLLAERRNDIKFNIGWEPPFLDDFRIEAEYNRNRSRNVTNAFPLLTPAIEGAFPDRVTRGPDGTLLALDARPVTFSEVNAERIRWGLNYRGEFGGNKDEGEGRRGRPGGDRPAPPQREAQQASTPSGERNGRAEGQSEGKPANGEKAEGEGSEKQAERPQQRQQRGGGRRGGGMFGRGNDGKARWNVSLYHTYTLQDEVVIRPELPTLDLLNGDAIGASGSPRHKVELQGGIFYKGMGMFLRGNYASATRVNGDPLTGSSDLFFGDLATFDLRLFANLEQVLKKKEGFFKGTRVSLRVDNLFGGIQNVRDADGNTPLRYQPGFVDPVGRFIEIDFRKQF